MLHEYLDFLKTKDSNSFWRKAHQREYTRDATAKIFEDLTTGFSKLTTRNSITLRYLGFIINRGRDRLDKTVAAQTFIKTSDKQRILDEQLMKVYLDCPIINARLSIKIIPLYVIFSIIAITGYITLDEYALFVCWVTDNNEIFTVAKFIIDFRKNKKEIRKYYSALREKSREFGISDFKGNIKRLFDMLLLSSYFRRDNKNIMIPALPIEDINVVIKGFDEEKYKESNYYDYLITNDGLNSDPYYINLIKSLKSKSPSEKDEIIKGVLQDLSLPSVDEIKPIAIDLKIGSSTPPKRASGKRKHSKKIDFEERETTNRRFGNHAELIVMKYEQEILKNNGKNKLADKIQRISLIDDSRGYDILSFASDGCEKHIEVKGVRGKPGSSFRFFVSQNEIDIAKSDKHYHLYIVFDLMSKNPSIFAMPNPFITSIPGVTVYPTKFIVDVQL